MSDVGEVSVQMNMKKMHYDYDVCKYCINGSTMNGINVLVRLRV